MQRSHRWWFVAAAMLSFFGCRCGPLVMQVEPARLVVEPERLVLPASYVGQSSSAAVTITNQGGATTTFTPALELPFTVPARAVTLARGEAEQLTVSFSPAIRGRASAVLRVG